ncbi:unnamed protein product [Lupinus luteus]|uniref:Polygalacturonase n=1 Tax=Lupinus luteus TaxID=3873 RepID=A0AAV1WR36_LUPLU
MSLLTMVFVTFSIIYVEARNKNHNKNKLHKPHKNSSNGHTRGGSSSPLPAPAPVPHYGPPPTQMGTFDVMSFGAKGNGISDDSMALRAAWNGACKVAGATVKVPAKHKFLIMPITLQGPCLPGLTLQIDGTLLAPPDASSWPKSSLFQWINFKWVQNLTIKGSGTVDGKGSNWWSSSESYDMQAIRFYASNYIVVRDIKIINSPLCHLKFDNSKGINVNNITISSPENSPNTDGIHLQNTQDVEIQHSDIGTGGLGKDNTMACVSNIIVEDITMRNTLYGARIKTWQGGIGIVKNVSFSRIQVYDVSYPITIDQYYCDKHICKNQTGTVVITGVKFDQISGSYATQPVHLACSNSIPCTDVDLTDIQLRPSLTYRDFQQTLCWNSYGKSQGSLLPSSIDYCLRSGGGSIKRIARSRDHSLCY